ncbi:MAG: hypothetical protein AVDCRST_MAG38-1021, partial [uncultured Solirubrobacteraceae bacterium]
AATQSRALSGAPGDRGVPGRPLGGRRVLWRSGDRRGRRRGCRLHARADVRGRRLGALRQPAPDGATDLPGTAGRHAEHDRRAHRRRARGARGAQSRHRPPAADPGSAPQAPQV